MVKSALMCSNVCKQCSLRVNNNNTLPSLQHIQLSYMFVNNNIHFLHDISNTLVDMCMKLHKHLGFGALVCSNVCKQCILCINDNNAPP